jgi:ATP-dependent DNA helicase RecG
MQSPIEKLAKFLRLEANRGFDNRAVFGGLQNMLEPWKKEAQENQIPEQLIEVVLSRLRDYPKLSPQSRQEVLNGLWNRLCSEYPELKNIMPEVLSLNDVEVEDQSLSGPASVKGEIAREEDLLPETEVEKSQAEETLTEVKAKATEAEETLTEAKAKATEAEETSTEAKAKVTEPEEVFESTTALEAPLTTLPGIGPKTARTLKKLGLETLGDLLWHLPRRYDDYTRLKTINRLWYGEEVTIIGTVEDIQVRKVRNGQMKLTEVVIGDGTGSLRVTWFNQPWIANKLSPGKGVVLSGKVDQYLGRLTMNSPEWEPLERIQLHTNRIVPVYPLTAGVTAKWLRRVINSVVSRYAKRIPDPLPSSVIESAQLMRLPIALKEIHFPDDWESLEKAQHRFAFDEMFFLQLGVLAQKHDWETLQTQPFTVDPAFMEHFIDSLPFLLTNAQKRALDAVQADLAESRPMNRLIQGDVGSGKTVVAAAAIAITSANGAQSAFMAPTSILAEQHLTTLKEFLVEGAGIPEHKIRLLLGSTPESEKVEIREGLSQGVIQVVVGTHALIEDPIQFAKLGLVIIDEQHRFGVNQRAMLRSKGENPNLLVMTATPIPRSLALTIYGDLDLTVIDEMPPGRKPIETRVLTPIERNRAYEFIKSQVESGRQAFIIYPLVEESEKVDAKAAVEEHQRLKSEVFPQYEVGLLHGRLRPDEKEEVMQRFRSGEYQILISTSVVEVGVDIPNTSVMLIEGANRFGLAQLHQFRGRVGRDDQPSYCLLIPDSIDNADNERLKAMEETQDGFELAEIDLDQRGPGDFLGTRQSGFAELQMARLTDLQLIEKARNEAKKIFKRDPDLTQPEHQALVEVLERFWTGGRGEIS